LKKLNGFIDERNRWAQYYEEQLADIDWLQTPQTPGGYRHGWQSYVTFVDESKAPMKRNEMMELLQQRGISTRPGTHAIHMLGAYTKKFGYKHQDFPSSFAADQFSMAIPLHNKMVKEDFDYIIHTLKSF
jgi:perosamine synthetase